MYRLYLPELLERINPSPKVDMRLDTQPLLPQVTLPANTYQEQPSGLLELLRSASISGQPYSEIGDSRISPRIIIRPIDGQTIKAIRPTDADAAGKNLPTTLQLAEALRPLGSITVRTFNFDAKPPRLAVAASFSKRRKNDVIPLRSDLADRSRSNGET